MIPVFEPTISDADVEAVVAAMRRGEISGTFGDAIPTFEARFAAYVGAADAVAVSSGTAALQLAVVAAGIGPGDEVLISAATNIATALAVVHAGALPVPVDSERGTWNLDLDLSKALITAAHARSCRSICSVIRSTWTAKAIAKQHNLVVIEDCGRGARREGPRPAWSAASATMTASASTRTRSSPPAKAGWSRPTMRRSPSACARCAISPTPTRPPGMRTPASISA